MLKGKVMLLLVLSLLLGLAACGPSVPAVVQTTIPNAPTIPPALATSASSAATTFPTILATVAPGAIATASSVPAAVGTLAANTLTVRINAENNSGETGTAVLTELSGKTTVVLAVQGEPSGASQPMHIHEGACGPTLGKVVFTLNPLANGVSTTIVDTTIANLKSAKYAINGHKSASEMSSYVFCGNLTQ